MAGCWGLAAFIAGREHMQSLQRRKPPKSENHKSGHFIVDAILFKLKNVEGNRRQLAGKRRWLVRNQRRLERTIWTYGLHQT